MKDKFKNLKNKKLLIFAVIVCAIAVLVFSTKEQLFKTNSLQTEDNKETISIKDANGKVHTKLENLNPSIKGTTNGTFKLNGKDIVKNAAIFLGDKYGEPDNKVVRGANLDCSQLVQSALVKSGVNNISGFQILDGHGKNIPEQTMDWFVNGNGAKQAWSQLKYWKYDTSTQKIVDIPYNKSNNDTYSIYKYKDKLTVDGQKINVLKVNDPITSNLRYYQYYDGTTKRELPMGTIIISYGSQWRSGDWSTGKQNHAWICIGNLGTTNANEAANILINMGIIEEKNRGHVVSTSSTNKYWRIENAGSTGVTINNGDPDMSLDGTGKKIGPIWAFQVANDNIGTISFGVNKVSSRNSNKKVNATFKYKLTTQNGNSSIKNGQIVANSGNKVTISNLERGKSYRLYLEEQKVTGYEAKFDGNSYATISIDNSGKVTWGKIKDSDGKEYGVTVNGLEGIFNLKDNPEPREISLDITKRNTDNDENVNATFQYWVSDTYETKVLSGNPTEFNTGSIPKLFTAYYDETTTKYVYFKESKVDGYSKGYFQNENNYIVAKITVSPTLSVRIDYPDTNKTYKLQKSGSKFVPATEKTNYVKEVKLDGTSLKATIVDPDSIDVKLNLTKLFYSDLEGISLSSSGINVDYWFSDKESYRPGNENAILNGQMSISTKGTENSPSISVKKENDVYIWIRENLDDSNKLLMTSGIFDDESVYIYAKVHIDKDGKATLSSVSSSYIVQYNKNSNTLTPISENSDKNKFMKNGEEKGKYISEIALEQNGNWNEATLKAKILDPLNSKEYGVYLGKSSTADLINIRKDIESKKESLTENDMLEEYNKIKDSLISGAKFKYISGWTDYAGNIYTDDQKKMENPNSLYDFIKLFPANKEITSGDELKLIDRRNITQPEAMISKRFFVFHEEPLDGYKSNEDSLILFEFAFEWQNLGIDSESNLKIKGTRMARIQLENSPYGKETDANGVSGTDFFYNSFMPAIVHNVLRNLKEYKELDCFELGGYKKYKYLTDSGNYNVDKGTLDTGITFSGAYNDRRKVNELTEDGQYILHWLIGAGNYGYGNATKDEQFNDERYNFYQYVVNNCGAAIILPTTNTLIFSIANVAEQGMYEIDIAKVGNIDDVNNKEKYIGGVKFTGNSIIDKSTSTNIIEREEKAIDITTKKGALTKINNTVIIRNETVSDIYELQEGDPPNGFTKYEHKIKLEITKEVYSYGNLKKKNRIKDIYAYIDINDDNKYDENDGEYYKKLVWSSGESIETILDDHIYINVESQKGDNVEQKIIFIVKDDEIPSGQYQMNIVKKSLTDTQKDNYASTEATYQNALASAVYSVTKKINNGSENTSSVTTKASEIQNITGGMVTINDVDKTDHYVIKETKASLGLNKSLDGTELGITIKKRLNTDTNKYEIDYITATFTGIDGEEYLTPGETLYLKSKYSSKSYFKDYVVAIQLKQNAGDSGDITVTWRNEIPTWGINLIKVNEEGDLIKTEPAEFSIGLYEDEGCQTEINKISDKDGNEISKINSTRNGVINLENIKIPQNFINSGASSKKYYLKITEIKAPTDYIKNSSPLVIPIEFTLSSSGQYNVNVIKSNAFVSVGSNKVGYENLGIKINFDINELSITYPNEPEKFSLYIAKVDENDQYVSGVEFNVNGKGGYVTASENSEAGSKGTVLVVDGEVIPQSADNTFKYEISEISVGNNDLIKLKDSITVYVKTKNNGTKYTIGSVSFSENSVVNSIQVSLENNVKVTASIERVGNIITVKVPNTKTEPGKYQLKLRKVNSSDNNSPVSGVTFSVKDGANTAKDYTTNSQGLASVFDSNNAKTINEDNVDTPDTYTITEVKLPKNSNLVKLSESVEFVVNKKFDADSNTYYVDSATFKDGTTRKQVSLQNGKKATVSIAVKDNIVTVTVPNEMKGSFEFNLIKYIKGTTTPLAGAKFNITINDGSKDIYKNTASLITNSKGKITIPSDKLNIESVGKTYRITINETEAPTGYTPIGIVTFTATSIKSGDEYVLKAEQKSDDNNCAKNVVITNKAINVEVENTPKNGTYNIRLIKKDQNGTRINETAKFRISYGYWDDNSFNEGVFHLYPAYVFLNSSSEKSAIWSDNGKELSTKNGIISVKNIKIDKDQIGERYYWVLEETDEPNGYVKYNGKIIIPVEFVEEGNSLIVKDVSSESCVIRNGQKLSLQDAGITFDEKTQTFEFEVKNTKETDEGGYSVELVKRGRTSSEDTTTKQLGGFKFNLIGATVDGSPLKDIKGNEYSKNNPYVISTNESVASKIWTVNDIDLNNIGTDDKYTLKEDEAYNNSGYYCGIKDEINLTVHKKSEKDEKDVSVTYKSVESATLTVGSDSVTVSATEPTKTITKTVNDVRLQIIIALEKVGNTEKRIKITVENPKLKGSFGLKVIKTANGSQPLAGAVFDIKVTDNVTNKVLAEQTGATSDENGLITLNKSIDIEDEGKMYKIDVVETKAPPGYQISEATKTFYVRSKLNDEKNGYILENEDHGDYVIENNLVTVKENNISVGKFGLHVHKYGRQNNGSGKPIANAVFDITINRGDEVVYKSPKSGDITNARGKIEILSDADGNEISMVEGEVFTVNIKETSAPVGYSIPDEFAGNGKTLTATVVRDTDGNLVLRVGNKIYANAILEVTVTENEKNQKGSYMLNLVKLGVNEDGTTTQLGGVTFNMIKASLNGYDNVETLYDGKYVNVSEQHPHVITTRATSPTPIWGDNNTGKINITKQDFDNDDTDSYTLVESNTGDNEDYYNGLSEKIKIDITRSTVVQSQNVLHYVKRVSLTIGSETRSIDIASNELISNEKYKEIVITKNIDGQDIDIKVRITKGTTDATSIQLIVENPHRNEGKYKISLLKYGVDADGVRTSQPLGGVTFGRVMTQKTSQGTAEEKVNDTIVTSDKSAVCISNINGLSDSDGYISTEKGDKVDNYTLTEKSIGDNTDYEIGLTDPIQLEVRKGVTSYQNHVKSSYFASVLLTIGKEQRYINVLNGDDTEQTITLTNKDGKMFNVTIKVENNTETNVADIVVEVENPSGPIIFTFDLKKYVKNVNPNQIVANAQFKISIINKETKRAVTDENGKFINGTRLYTVDENGEIIIKGMEIDSVGTVYEVTLSEYSVPKGLTKMDSVIKFEIEAETNKKVKIVDNSFGLYKLKNGSYTLVDKNDKEYSLVRKIGVSESETGTSVVEVIMDNTAEYQFRIIKRNAAKTAVSGSRFTVIRENTDGTLTPILTDQPSQVLTEKPDKPGVYKYYITETATPPNSDTGLPGAQYINVLRGKFFKVYLKYEANGNLTVVNKYSNPENNYCELYEGEVSNPKSGVKINSDYLKDYVSVSISNVYSSKFEKELDIDIVNPISYGLNITKLNADISGNSTLQNAEFKVRREVAMTNGNTAIGTNEKRFESVATSSTEVIESAMFAGKYIYYITETKAPNSKFTNILENQYIKLYVIVDGDGRVRLANSNWVETTGYFEWYKGNIDDPKSTDEKVTTNGPMGMFVNVNVSESDHVYTINFNVYDPVKLAFKIYKEDATSNTRLKDINFQIENYTWWGCGKKEFTTDENGTITYEADKVPAGIYEYNVSELESDNEIFNNLFKDYKIKIFMKISGDGSIKFVSDKNGTEFSSTVPSDKYFHIYKGDVLADNKAKHLINLISLKTEAGEIPTVALKVSNTKKYKIDLIKKDSNDKELTGALFEVKRNSEKVFDGEVTDKVEVSEDGILPGEYEYYITEKSITNNKGIYVNVFKDKAIKLSLTVDKNGAISLKENNGLKFQVCSINKDGSYNVLDKSDVAYKFVKDISIVKDANEVSVVNVEVENPTRYNFNIIKKNAAETDVNGSKFTAYREDSDGNVTQVLNNEELKIINETPMRAGNYIYYITENSTPTNNNSKPGAQYVNVLKGKYMKVYVHLDANGRLTITNSNFVGSEKYYELYEGDITTRNGKKINNDSCISVSVDSRGTASTEKTLVINVVNPITYNLDIVKQDTTGKSLANSKFKVRRQVVSTNSNDKIFDDAVNDKVEVTENRMLAGNYIYYIKETSSPATKYCNILEDGYLKLYAKVYGDGKVTLTNSKFEDSTSYYEWRKGNIDDPKDTDTLVATSGPMGRFVKVYVQESNSIYTIRVEVKNPLKLEFGIHKVVANSENNIPNVKFNITNSISGNTKTVITDKDGLASVSEEDVSAGIYKFEITEIETASEIYNNLLEEYKIVVYLKITGDGTITYVSDENGTEFGSTVAADKHFHVYKDNTNVDATKEGKAIISLVSLKTQDGAIPKTVLKVGNTLNYKMNLTKKDTANNTLTGSIFVVKRFNNEIFNGGVTDDTEITEKNMLPGTYDYYITESSISNKNGTYVNVFKDKAIKLFLALDNKGNITIIEKGGKKFEICSVSNGKYTVLNDDIAYQFVKNIEITKDSNGVNIIQVEVENPTNYNFNVIKKDAAENNVKGSKFTAYREDSNGNIKQVLNNEELKIINETPMRAGNYIYYITETATPGKQYVNVLEGKYMKVYVHLDANGRLSITNSKFQVADNYYEIYKGDISKRDGTKVENSEFISVNVSGPQNNVYTLNVVVTNPVKINTNIIKKDTSNNDLASSHFKVRRQDVSTKTFSDRFEGEVTSGIEKTESPMRAGNYIYYVTEKSSPSARYTNILEKTYLKIYVKISGDGKVVITDSKFNESAGYYEWYNGDINNPKDSDTKIDKSDPRNQYIKDISTSVEDSIYTVNVTVVNPVKIRVNVNKKIFGDDEVNLQNVEIKAETPDGFTGVVTKVTDKDGNISFIDQYANAGLRRYLVTEAKPAGEEFVNVLEHKEILVYTIVKADGTFQIVDEDGVPTENKWYAYNNTDSNNKVKLNENTDVIKNFVKVSQSVGKDGISELNFAIKNPQKYKLHLRKIDKDNKKGMNGVTFDLSVSDGKNIVKLRNANTLENMNTEGLVTSTVDGADGVIEINDILIEKSGTYTYTLHEHSTDGIFDWLYKNHKDDIILRIKIVVRDGKYVIENLETVQGGDYVGDLSIGTGIGSTIKNERIKGKYDLILNKVDSYTEKALDGAVFNIHVEKDGKEHTLYKSTEDVDSMEQILPADNVVVKNGKLEIKDIRIEEIGRDRLEEYTIVLTEVTAPKGYMLLDAPIKLKVTTNTTGKFDDEKYIVESVELVDDENHGLVTFDYNENKIVVTAKNEYFDLALRKSITSVAYPDTNEGEITEEETKDRIPEVITDGINEGPNGEDPTETTAVYNHKKNPVRAYKEQEVIYTLRVYNEGEIDGYAEEITDHLPEWLEFVDDDFNKERGWSLDENDETGRTVRTKNLSKAYADENGVDNLIKAKNKVTGDLDSKEIQIKCRVSEKAKLKTVLTNIAEISLSKADDRTSETVDRDSVTNNVKIPETSEEMSKYKDDELNKTYVPGQEDDDDFEKVIVEAFDLSLRKYITAVNDEQMLKDNTDTEDKKQNTQDKNNESTKDENSENTEDKNKVTNDESTNNETTKDEGQEKTDDSQEGNNNDEEQKDTVDDNSADLKYAREPLINIKDLRDKPDDVTTATYTHTKEPVEVSVDDIVTYTISVYNEGTVSGYASLIKDDIPEGLEYVKDSEINKKFNWKLLDENNKETDDVKKAKYIVSDYLSKENGDDNILNAFNGEKLDTKYVQVDFKVICKQDWAKIIKNEAQISDDQDDRGKPVRDRDSTPNEWKGEDDEDVEYIRVTYMDLALRKFITGVNKQIITDRIPEVDATALKNKENTTADYKHTKEPVIVHTNDTVIYTIRIYNEGSKDGYATQIKDDIPEGLEFIPYNETNKMYEWKMLDAEGKETLDVSKVKSVVTHYCSKDKETEKRQNLMLAFERPDGTTFDTPEYKDVKIAFKVVEPTTSDRILINHAQISEQTDKKGIHREDRDSTPNEWKGEDDEDIEKVRVLYFDLALRKWVTNTMVTENGQTFVTETGHHAEDDPEEVVKVDLKKSKINSVVVKFEYKVRITNEGEIAGYAKEIKDRIPDGLEFEEADNPNWKMLEDGTVVTDELKDKLLQPGESAEVIIVLKWINSPTNLGVKINFAEISKDHNDYGTPDIDSTPNNNVPGEDDIDDAPVMLTVKTGSQDLKYMLAILVVLTALVGSVSLLKKNLQKNKYN